MKKKNHTIVTYPTYEQPLYGKKSLGIAIRFGFVAK